jgi:hypothetical protein
MSISEIAERLRQNGSNDALSFERLHLREEELPDIRRRLYHSSGDGYYVFRRFVSPDLVKHMRSIWTTVDPETSHKLYTGNHNFYVGCPNFYARYGDDGSLIFYNFFFAPPLDEVTYEISVCVHALRNRLAGRNAFDEIWGRRAVSYRVLLNLNRTTWAAPHTDFMDYERRWEKGYYDPSRLQATLFLSEKGADYTGTGFRLRSNSGRSVVFGEDVPVAAGDLVIWRYGNQHSVEDVATPPGQFGFMRILYPIYDLPLEKPPETVSAPSVAPPRRSLPRRVASRLLRTFR